MAIRTVTIVLAAFGGLVLLGSGASAAVAGVDALTPASDIGAVDVSGVQKLDARVDGAELRIEFYDGDRAQLFAEHGSTNGWTVRTEGDELQVRSPQRWFGWNWFLPDWLGDGWFDEGDRVTLQLPESLAGLDADLTLNAGALSADGEFEAIDVDVSAGRMDLSGSADRLQLTLSAGAAGVDLDGVDQSVFEISAGRADAVLSGVVPSEVTADVSAGQLNLTLPEGEYDVRQDVSAGSLDNRLGQHPDSTNVVRVSVSAGTVNLREG